MSERDDDDGPTLRVRTTPELLARLDADAERMTREIPGVKITRSDVVRAILIAGLEVRERMVAAKGAD